MVLRKKLFWKNLTLSHLIFTTSSMAGFGNMLYDVSTLTFAKGFAHEKESF